MYRELENELIRNLAGLRVFDAGRSHIGLATRHGKMFS